MSLQTVRGKVFQEFCCRTKQPLYQVSHSNICSPLACVFSFIMLTTEAHSVENDCKHLHPSEINIYDVCARCERNILLTWGEKIQLTDINKGKKMHCSLSHICETVRYVGAGSVSGCSCSPLYLHNLSSSKCCRSYVGDVGGRGGSPWPQTFCFSDLAWHLASSLLVRQLLCTTTKWSCKIPFLVSKPSPDSWLVNSTRKPCSQARRVLPEWELPCGNPWQSYSAERSRKKWGGGGGERWVEEGGSEGISYATILH